MFVKHLEGVVPFEASPSADGIFTNGAPIAGTFTLPQVPSSLSLAFVRNKKKTQMWIELLFLASALAEIEWMKWLSMSRALFSPRDGTCL